MFNLFNKKTQLVKDHISDSIKELQILTERMNIIEKRRNIHEKFISDVLSKVDPKLLEKDKDGIFLFLSDNKARQVLKIILEEVLKGH